MRRVTRSFGHFLRTISLVLIAVCLTTALVRDAPGYFSDAGELDAEHASSTRTHMSILAEQDASTARMLEGSLKGALHGDLGESRQFGVPVRSLLNSRLRSSTMLLLKGLALGWVGALSTASILVWRRHKVNEFFAVVFSSALLAVPIGAAATICLTLDRGGPVVLLAVTVGVRVFKLLYRLLLQLIDAHCIEYARASGLRPHVIFSLHLGALLRYTLPQLMMTSVIGAIEAIVPLEVVFDLPGIGQLAWSAAMHRDAPVLQIVTVLIAGCVALSGTLASAASQGEAHLCAP